MTVFVNEDTSARQSGANTMRARLTKASKNRRVARSVQEEKAPLSDVWTPKDATSAKLVRKRMKKGDYVTALPTKSLDGLVKVLKDQNESSTKATEAKFVLAYGTVVQAENDGERQIMYEAVCKVLGKKRYKNSNLVSLMLQALDFSPDQASKRGTISRYAMEMGVAPAQLSSFVKRNGGLESCKKAALDFEQLLGGTVQVGLVVKTAKTKQRHVLCSFKSTPLIEAVQEFYDDLKPDRQEIARVVDASIVKLLLKTVVKKET